MINRSFYLALALRILPLIILSSLIGFFIATDRSPVLILLCFAGVMLSTISLVKYLNTANDRIRFFFDAIRNEDSTLSFPVESENKSLRELYRSMNRVNQQIQQLKIENRQQEQYFARLIEHLATGIITFNRKGFVFHANSAAKRLLSTDILTHLQQIERINQRLYQAISNIKPPEQKLVSVPLHLEISSFH